jgi:hypothetical protein
MTDRNFNSRNRFYQKQIADLIERISASAGPGWPDMVYEEVIGYVKASSIMYGACKSIQISNEHELQGVADCLQIEKQALEERMQKDDWVLKSEVLRDAFRFSASEEASLGGA